MVLIEEKWKATYRIQIGWWKKESSGVVFEMLRAGGEPCLTSLIGRFNDLYFEGRLEGGWILSSLVAILKGNHDPLKPEFEHRNESVGACFQVFWKDFSWMIQWIGSYWQDAMQVCAGKGIVSAVFFPRRHTENFRSKSKVFDWVPREIFCFTLTQTSVLKYFLKTWFHCWFHCNLTDLTCLPRAKLVGGSC